MSKENKSRYALLGMLSLQPMSGYELKKAIEYSVGHFWHESYPQIYPILKSLTDEGLTTCTVTEQQGRPDRYTYTLTDQGWEVLRQWLTEPFETRGERNELLLKLFFGNLNPTSVSVEHILHQRGMQEHLLHVYEQTEAELHEQHADDPSLVYWLLTLNQGKHIAHALIAWCDESLALLQRYETRKA
jgi:PadR family transcriptional regulator AphA